MRPSIDLTLLLGEWWLVRDQDQAAELTREVQRELTPGHVLHGLRIEAVAVKRHLKDVIFWLPDSSQWALVHLTYKVEPDPRWPTAIVASDWLELVDELTAD